MIDNRGEFRRFFESKTGYILASLMTLSALGALCNRVQTEPGNFSDLKSRFRIMRSIDVDGVNKLSVYRTDSTPLNWYDNDLVALERTIGDECGKLSKFTGETESQGQTSVNFRLLRPPYNCSYLQNTP